MDLNDIICYWTKRINTYFNKKRLVTSKFEFIDRGMKSENLLMIIVGFQPFYWEAVFERVQRNKELSSESIDVCVCVPGQDGEIIKEYCKRYGWSYLRISTDRLSQIQNLAIELHPSAEWIYKIDEDIILCDNYFQMMKETYCRAEAECAQNIGFVGPLLNLNACCTPIFIKTINAEEEYANKYGKLKIGLEYELHTGIDTALWIWEKSVPFDKVAKQIRISNKEKYSIGKYRYSIGAILFKRSFWKEIGYFVVGSDGESGMEEAQICSYCMNSMRAIVIAEDIFVGHLGFFRQKEAVRSFFEKNKDSIML